LNSASNPDRQPKKKAFLSVDAYEERIHFLDRSGIGEARLIGGEPTLHPKFPELVRLARMHGKRIVVFTNGLVNEKALTCLAALPIDECTVLVNMNASHGLKELAGSEAARRLEILRCLGYRALPGFNIYQVGFQLEWLLNVIEETDCRKAIRLGLAQPLLNGENRFLHPKQYAIVGQKITQLAKQAAKNGIRLEFDCGFVPCMFSEQDLNDLRQANADIGWRCSPILDIGLDGQAMHCFPLSGKVTAQVDNDTNAADLIRIMTKQVKPYRISGIYKECSTCVIKSRGDCTGGCLANTVRRFHRGSVCLVLPKETTLVPFT
jgi:MoaA/NifB/PqqE/SkfB family radical SAM enzyme